eukprot:jgi/Chrzof1/3340/Cz12g21140.t1
MIVAHVGHALHSGTGAWFQDGPADTYTIAVQSLHEASSYAHQAENGSYPLSARMVFWRLWSQCLVQGSATSNESGFVESARNAMAAAKQLSAVWARSCRDVDAASSYSRTYDCYSDSVWLLWRAVCMHKSAERSWESGDVLGHGAAAHTAHTMHKLMWEKTMQSFLTAAVRCPIWLPGFESNIARGHESCGTVCTPVRGCALDDHALTMSAAAAAATSSSLSGNHRAGAHQYRQGVDQRRPRQSNHRPVASDAAASAAAQPSAAGASSSAAAAAAPAAAAETAAAVLPALPQREPPGRLHHIEAVADMCAAEAEAERYCLDHLSQHMSDSYKYVGPYLFGMVMCLLVSWLICECCVLSRHSHL